MTKKSSGTGSIYEVENQRSAVKQISIFWRSSQWSLPFFCLNLVLLSACDGLYADLDELRGQDQADVGIVDDTDVASDASTDTSDADAPLPDASDDTGEPSDIQEEPTAPIVETSAVLTVTADAAILRGQFTNPGHPLATDHGFCIDLEADGPFDECYSLGAAEGDAEFDFELTDFVAGATYFVRAYATNDVGDSQGDAQSFLLGFESMAAGDQHTCGITSDQSLWCWGANLYGEVGVDPEVSDFLELPRRVGAKSWLSVSAGQRFTCAIDEDESLFCWGRNRWGALGTDESQDVSHSEPKLVDDSEDWLEVVSGNIHSCARRQDSSLWCWGSNSSAQLGVGFEDINHFVTTPSNIGSDKQWTSVATGAAHTCATDDGGSLWCWGRNSNSSRQLGLGDTPEGNSPVVEDPTHVEVPSEGSIHWVRVVAGRSHTCGLDTEDIIRCWGSNQGGALGFDAPPGGNSTPKRIDAVGDERWHSLSLGHSFTCAVRVQTNELYCWGDGSRGRTGHGNLESHTSPTKVGQVGSWQTLALGTSHACGTRGAGELYCWGSRKFHRAEPVPISIDDQLKDIAGGRNFGCAVDESSEVLCWGSAENGRLGIGENAVGQQEPHPIEQTPTKTVSTGVHSCSISDDGQLYCWGHNHWGQLGVGDREDHYEPAGPVTNEDEVAWASVSTSPSHSCGIDVEGGLWCWGSNQFDQLTSVSPDGYSETPLRIADGDDWSDVAAGEVHTCAVRADGELYCWGYNVYGQLGLGEEQLSEVIDLPTRVGEESDWVAVTTYMGHTCALREFGSLWCWGYRNHGALGLGEVTAQATPAQVVHPDEENVSELGWKHVETGLSHTCAIDVLDRLWCWGSNNFGRLGLGDQTNRNTPHHVAPGTTWQTISLGDNQTYGIDKELRAWAWGRAMDGELGDGQAWIATPTRIADRARP